jgi:hypothetical protein
MGKEPHQGQRSGDLGTETYQRDVEACKNVFVSWFWLIGILSILALGAWGASSMYSNRESSQDARIEKNNDAINQSKSDIAKGFNDMDKNLDEFKKGLDQRLNRIENKLDRR